MENVNKNSTPLQFLKLLTLALSAFLWILQEKEKGKLPANTLKL